MRIEINEVLQMKRRKNTASTAVFYAVVAVLFLVATIVGNHAVTAISENLPIERKNRIVIDAGHGGEDGGAMSCTGIAESGINLEIALRTNDLLNLLGYDTVMIRTTDTAVYTQGSTIAQKKISDLKERVRIVNETPNALLLSIHQNHFSDSRYSGGQVFYASNSESKLLAEMLQALFLDVLNPGSNRQCKEASGIYLMNHISCVGILVECGFLSNAEEEAKLSSRDYQQKIACVLAAALGTYLSNAPRSS